MSERFSRDTLEGVVATLSNSSIYEVPEEYNV